MTVSDNTIKPEGLEDFFRNLGKKGLIVSKKKAENVLKNPGRALDLTKLATATDFRNSRKALSTISELITFYNTRKSLYLDKLVFFISYRWIKKTERLPMCTPRKNCC